MRALAVVVLSAFVAIYSHPAAADALTVREWAEAFAKPAVVGDGIDAAGRKLKSGHLDLSFERGRLYPVVVGGRISGVFFAGIGSFRYVSADPFEAVSFRENLLRASSYKMEEKGVLSDSFTKVLFMLSSGAEGISKSPEWSADMGAGSGTQAFAGHLKRYADNHGAWRYTQLMPQAMADPPPRPLIVAEITAGKHDLFYAYDSMRDHDEYIAVIKKSRSSVPFLKNRRYPWYLSTQPLERRRLEARPVSFVLTELDVEIVNPRDEAARILVEQTIEARIPVKVLDFHLATEVIGGAGHLQQIDYTLTRVTDAAGKKLAYSHLRNDLLVEMPTTLAPGDKVKLRFEMAGDILYRPRNDSYWQLGSGAGWYPTPNRLTMGSFVYHAVIKAPKPFVPFSNGQTVRRWEEDDLACAEFREPKPIRYAVALAGKYKTYTETRNGLTLNISSYAGDNRRAAKTLAKVIFASIELYEPLLGDYPFPEINVIEINSLGFGQAPAGVIYITKEAFNPLQGDGTRIFSQGVNRRIAHEVAHAWWGHVARFSDPEDQWLSESTADYFGAFAMQKLLRKSEFTKSLAEWQRGAKESSKFGSVYMANYITNEQAREVRHNLLYNKGPLVLHALRQELGDEKFFTILKSFLRSFPMQNVSTIDFVDLTSYIAKKDYGPWYERYLFGTEVPKIRKD